MVHIGMIYWYSFLVQCSLWCASLGVLLSNTWLTLYCWYSPQICVSSVGQPSAWYKLVQFWYIFGVVHWCSPWWCGSLLASLASNAHLGDSPLARASHCIMRARTKLYTTATAPSAPGLDIICITVLSNAQCMQHLHRGFLCKMQDSKCALIAALDKWHLICCNI